MSEKAEYKTKQMEELVSYLKSTEGRHVTAAEIRDHFAGKGVSIGTATVYRRLERMVVQGLVSKTMVEGSSACFSYIGDREHCHHPACYHCKCEKCGRLIHLQCPDVSALAEHMSEHHGFSVDFSRTVFYGLCDDCRKKTEAERT